jgi:hypothetical protein
MKQVETKTDPFDFFMATTFMVLGASVVIGSVIGVVLMFLERFNVISWGIFY